MSCSQCVAVVLIAGEAAGIDHQALLVRHRQADPHAKLVGIACLALGDALCFSRVQTVQPVLLVLVPRSLAVELSPTDCAIEVTQFAPGASAPPRNAARIAQVAAQSGQPPSHVQSHLTLCHSQLTILPNAARPRSPRSAPPAPWDERLGTRLL